MSIIAMPLCPADAGSLVTRVRDWPHSSFHRDARAELFPEDWAGDVSAEGDFGERVCCGLGAPFLRDLGQPSHVFEFPTHRVPRRRQIISRLQIQPIFRRLPEHFAES
jgi:hypothetical protein